MRRDLAVVAWLILAACGREDGRPIVPSDVDPVAAVAAGDHLLLTVGGAEAAAAALPRYLRAAMAFERAGELVAAGDAWLRASAAQHVIGDEGDSLALATTARALYRRAGARQQEADALDSMATSETHLGQVDQALAHHQEGLAISRDLDDPLGVASRLLGIAFALLRADRWQDALDAGEEAVALYRQLEQPLDEASARNNLGFAYYVMGDAERALEQHQAALAIRRRLDDRPKIATSLLNLAAVEAELRGDPGRGLAHAEEALAVQRSDGRTRGIPGALAAVGRMRLARGEVEGALAVLRDAEAGWLALDHAEGAARTQIDLGATLRARGELAEARVAYDAAVAQAGRAGRSGLEARARAGRAWLAHATGDRAGARRDVDRALAIVESLRAGVAREELRASYFATVRAIYELDVDLRAADGDVAGALEASERARARALLDALRLAGDPRADAAPLAAAHLIAMLEPDTVVIEYLVGADRGWAWAITDQGVTMVALAAEAELDAAARRLAALLTARNRVVAGENLAARRRRIAGADAGVEPAARALATLVIAPLAGFLDRRRVVIVPDGALHAVPFALLPGPAGRRLGADHELSSLPSLSVLAELRDRAAGTWPPSTITVLADPVFGADDPRLPAPARGPAATLPRLPFTADEAAAIAALAPDRTTVLRGLDARREALAGDAVRGAGVLHVASHALVDGARPERTGLVLSMVDAEGAAVDGVVRIAELEHLELDAGLVVLSACRSALGKQVRGEGLVGLVRGLLRAGVPRVVATLWQVDDRATAELMRRFYAHLLGDLPAPAAALRAAQAELAADPRWTSPFYWAGVVVSGDWR